MLSQHSLHIIVLQTIFWRNIIKNTQTYKKQYLMTLCYTEICN